jgi:DNA-binding MarR family transcriptional regulator
LVKLEFEDINVGTYTILLHTAYMAQKYANGRLEREAGISAMKYRALGVLAACGGVMRPSDMARLLFRNPHNITTLTDRMSNEGLVRTERDSKDRRSVNIRITDKGRKMLADARPVSRDIVKQVMSSISKEDAVTLQKLVGVLLQNLEKITEHEGTLT